MARDLRPHAAAAGPVVEDGVDPADFFALVVGIDRYPGFGDLRGACNDAEAFHGWLVDPAGGRVPPENTRVHLGRRARDVRTARPVKRDVDLDLHDLVGIVRGRGRPCRLFLYFAGHGVAAGLGDAAVVMADAQPGLCYNLSLGTYQGWLDRCRDFAEVVLFSDCCRSVVPDAPEGTPPHTTCVEPGAGHHRALVAHAADLGRTALEWSGGDPSDERGYFTTVLLDGLRGGGADERTGDVTAGHLAAFLEDQLPRATGNTQRPDTRVSSSSLLVLATVAPTTYEVSVHLAPGPLRTIRLLGPDSAPVASTEQEGGVWTVHVGSTLYELDDPQRGEPLLFRVSGPRDVEA